jgi:hypothetical protein
MLLQGECLAIEFLGFGKLAFRIPDFNEAILDVFFRKRG